MGRAAYGAPVDFDIGNSVSGGRGSVGKAGMRHEGDGRVRAPESSAFCQANAVADVTVVPAGKLETDGPAIGERDEGDPVDLLLRRDAAFCRPDRSARPEQYGHEPQDEERADDHPPEPAFDRFPGGAARHLIPPAPGA